MSSLPRAVQVILDNASGAMDLAKDAIEDAKPSFTSGFEAGKHISNSVLALAIPFIKSNFEAGKNYSATALANINRSSLQYLDSKEAFNIVMVQAKLLFSIFQAGNRLMKAFLLTLLNATWEKVCQHPFSIGLAQLFALFTLVLGPLWPLRILLRIVGFGATGIIFNSIAAAVQGRIGNVVAGSSFAVLQALGARIGL